MGKPKLKSSLAAEKGIDFKQQKLNKLRKEAEKKKAKRRAEAEKKGVENESEEEGSEVEDQDDVAPLLVPVDAVVKSKKDKKDKKDKKGDKKADRKKKEESEDKDEEDEEDEEDEWEDEEDEEEGSDGEDGDEGEEGEEDDDEEDDDASVALSDISDLDADVIPHQTLTINNTAALTSALNRIAVPPGPFSLLQRVTTANTTLPKDIHDDLNRELSFYQQALAAAKKGRDELRKEKVPFTRPNDYFAEMVKSDEHMGQVKGRMLEIAANKKAAADARKLRDAKKFGKKVQQEKLASREAEKKKMLERVESLKRKRGNDDLQNNDDFDVALEEAISGKETRHNPNAKRQKRDAKYGYGGKKKRAKSNTFESSSDLTGFSSKAMKAKGFSGPGKKGGKKRLGKSKRQAGKK